MVAKRTRRVRAQRTRLDSVGEEETEEDAVHLSGRSFHLCRSEVRSEREHVTVASSKIIMICGHCGNTTAFTVAAEGFRPTTIDANGAETTAWTTWRVLLCSTCSQPTLERDVQTVRGGPDGARPPRGASPELLYPVAQTLGAVLPSPIGRMYLETLRVEKRSPRACAVMAGLTLEAVCQHEHAKGSSLSERLNHLVASERIPKTLAEMAHHLRQLRNIGAHVTQEDILPEDVPVIIDFVEAILEYLYVAPAKIRAVQERLRKLDDAQSPSKKGQGGTG